MRRSVYNLRHMGALADTDNPPNPQDELERAIDNMLAALSEIAGALPGVNPDEISAQHYAALAHLIYAPAWEAIVTLFHHYQTRHVEDIARRIAGVTGRKFETVEPRVWDYLRDEAPADMTFSDCLLTLESELLIARYAGAPAFRFAFDLAKEEA